MNSAPQKPPDPETGSRRIVALPGDGVGPEVVKAARVVLGVLAEKQGLDFNIEEHLIGGSAIDATGYPLPSTTLDACEAAEAVLLGAVGGPAWDHLSGKQRPEAGLLGLRSELGLFCNLRPVSTHPSLHHFSPIRSERLNGVDLVLVRELTGGIYFGDKSRSDDEATDICRYSRMEIERITRKACELASGRRGKLTLVDKANVLETSRLWRDVVTEITASEFPALELEILLVDAAAMHLLSRPADFDVMLTENLFGDILSDEASMLSGSMGLLSSASLRDDNFGLYEPIHGSAPDIAGKGVANPCGMLLSVAMMLRYSLACAAAADALESAVRASWEAGVLTPDLGSGNSGTSAVVDFVCDQLLSEAHPVPAASAGGG